MVGSCVSGERLIRFMYPDIDWELLPFPRPEDFDSEEDFERELRMTMLLNDTTRATWPPIWRFELDFAMNIAFPLLIVGTIVILIVVGLLL